MSVLSRCFDCNSMILCFQEAEDCYLKALKFRKKYPDAYFNLGNMVSYVITDVIT